MNSCRLLSRSLLVLLGAGLLLRFLLAYVILPGSGYAGDVGLYSRWALAMASVGPAHLYATTSANYPPGYMYVLWLVGAASQAIAAVSGTDVREISILLIKVPPMLLDAATGFLLYWIVRHLCAMDVAVERRALAAAAIYLFNPVSLYDSAIWGQTDSVGAFIMLLGVIALLRWPSEIAASIAVISSLIKPQFGVVLLPLISVPLLRRHALSHHSHADESPPHSHWRDFNGPVRLVTSAVVALTVFYALLAPFNWSLRTFFDHMSMTAQQYKLLSVNGFNPWVLASAGGHNALLLGGIDQSPSDDIPLVGVLTGVMIGSALLACGFLLGVARLLLRSDLLSVALVGAYFCLCFFILPTRVHERYIFPALAFTSLLAVVDRRWLWATFALSTGSLMNLHAVLSLIGTENIVRLPFGSFLRSPVGILISMALQTTVFIFASWRLWWDPVPAGNTLSRAPGSYETTCIPSAATPAPHI